MKALKKILINGADFSAPPLSRERMKAIKGGGGNCYAYCGGYNSISMTIVQSCSSSLNCGNGNSGVPYCFCN